MDDPHVEAVVATCAVPPVVFDTDSLSRSHYLIKQSEMVIELENETFRLAADSQRNGWIRRLTPMDWEHNLTIGSRESALKASWLSLAAHIARSSEVRWLSTLDSIHISESKLRQYSLADDLGIDYPETLVSNIERDIADLPGPWIAKPLGPSHFQENDGLRVLYATDVDRDATGIAALGNSSPFLLQQRISASTHLRIVTVGSTAWVCGLDAHGLDLDWRREQGAGHDWYVIRDDEPTYAALRLSDRLGLGYSSQDWIVDGEGRAIFLDFNPAGQWLFLPEPVATEIAQAIGSWLCR